MRLRPTVRREEGRTAIRAPRPEDARALLALRLANRAFVAPWDPIRPASFFTLGGQRAAVSDALASWREDRRYAFVVCDAADGDEPIGNVTLDNILRGAAQGATLGYWIDRDRNGLGHGTQAARLALRFAFEDVGLHRVQASVMPANVRSARVLAKAGLRREGRAARYLRIAGAWEDHDIYAITAEELGAT